MYPADLSSFSSVYVAKKLKYERHAFGYTLHLDPTFENHILFISFMIRIEFNMEYISIKIGATCLNLKQTFLLKNH
jgi:hypothetical protein